ncbi:DUF6236 family protein [Shinella sp. M31]|uniref:DUF6236 family protein n=1 Tax=Shinella sp. M31 TaxID=3368615 RepID=UPI003B9DDA31
MRGIIVMPGVSVRLPKGVTLGGGADPQLLRAWLLYWDEIVYPEPGSAFYVGLGDDIDYLESLSVFRRHRIDIAHGEVVAATIAARTRTFEQLEQAAPGAWALASGPGAWDGPEQQDARALQVNMVNALPIPNIDVPLDDILAFRVKRRDQREALMSHINDTYQSVLRAPDRPLAEHDALERLARSAREQLEVVQEAGFSFRLGDIASDFNLAAAAVAGTGSLSLGASWPAAIGNSLLAGASVTIGTVFGLKNRKSAPTPFQYVVSYHNEIFGMI